MSDIKQRCRACGWEGTDYELDTQCVFHGNQEEPPEYEAFCPSCGGSAEDCIEEVPVCRTCEDTYVQHEGDQCEICRQEELEEACDRMIDDSLIGG